MKTDATLIAYVGLTVLALVALAEWADPTPPAGEGCRVGYVHDGDTVELICGPRVTTARLVGLDAPELDGRCPAERAAAQAARRALAAAVRGAARVDVRLDGRDRYGRDLVHLTLDGRDAAARIIAEGHARPYTGGARLGWC